VLGFLGLLGFNVILIAIAVFIAIAGEAELQQVLSERALEGVLVDEACVRAPVLDPEANLQEASERFIGSGLTRLALDAPPGQAGVVTLETVAAVDKERWSKLRARDVAQPCRRPARLGQPLSEVIAELGAAPEGVLPVYDEDEVVGVLRSREVRELILFRGLRAASRAARAVASEERKAA
jgi:hypothetical protein